MSALQFTGDWKADRDAVQAWARKLLAGGDFIVLDSETTGLRGAEVVQIGLLWPDGAVALDSLVRPSVPIPHDASRIHGITDAAVADAPTLHELLPLMAAHMHGREVVVYNKGFDQGTLWGCLRRCKGDLFADTWIGASVWTCAMLPWAAFVGEWNDYRGDYRWQKLESGDHSAIGDCRATLRLIHRMAEEETP